MSDIKQSNSVIAKKSYAFALDIISIYKLLINERKEFILSKQLLCCGISIGANVHEAISSESKRDFVHKLSIALKEAKEISYKLNLLNDSCYISKEHSKKLNILCSEAIKILNSIILTYKSQILF